MRKKYISGSFAFKCDIGKIRLTNEDKCIALTNQNGNVLMIVCDGMGGQNKGEYASTLAIDTIKESFEKKEFFKSGFTARKWLYSIISKANEIINKESENNQAYKGMGTTLTAVLILQIGVYIAQVGDSRAYVLRNKFLTQLTEDQTYTNFLYKTGKIKENELKTHPQRHILMNALGAFASAEVEVTKYRGDYSGFLLCSDGLYNNVSENDMRAILNGNDSVEQKVNELVSMANANGGSDNIAVVLWEDSNYAV